MFIIFIAHMPMNVWNLWIPARYGFSDATEIFVFCSGMASAIAFGKVFDNYGWFVGAARIVYRVWQVYWAHIMVFFAILTMLVVADSIDEVRDPTWHLRGLNLQQFIERPQEALIGLFTLTYVPNLFDILPMYLVILAMIPILVPLGRIDPRLVFVAMAVMWLAASNGLVDLPARPWNYDVHWFFNPFAWQLVFFTGFAFMRGWIKPPPVNRWLIGLAIAVSVLSFPYEYFRVLRAVEFFNDGREVLKQGLDIFGIHISLVNKTEMGILRFTHFLAWAYLAWVVAGEGGKRLIASGLWGAFVRVVMRVGQQSLAVFLMGLVAARGLFLIREGLGVSANEWWTAVFNLIGFAILIATAYVVHWYKSQPWKRQKHHAQKAAVAMPASDASPAGASSRVPAA